MSLIDDSTGSYSIRSPTIPRATQNYPLEYAKYHICTQANIVRDLATSVNTNAKGNEGSEMVSISHLLMYVRTVRSSINTFGVRNVDTNLPLTYY